MKKLIIVVILLMNIMTVEAQSIVPTYKIIANSNEQFDIEEMYTTKNNLLNDYNVWVKGVDDVICTLIDHQYVYDASFYNGQYTIILGEGNGKSIEGKLQTNYCSTTTDIKKTSWIMSLFD